MIFKTTAANIPIFFSYMLSSHTSQRLVETTPGIIVFSIVFVLAFLVAYITLEVIPKKGEELLAATYPAYKLA